MKPVSPSVSSSASSSDAPAAPDAARRRLLDRAPEPGEREAWAEHYAKPPPAALREPERAFVFRLGDEWLALPAPCLREAATPRPIHSVPHRRAGLLAGLVNLDGELVPCVRLERALGLTAPGRGAVPAGGPSAAASRARRLLVVAAPGGRLALEADQVYGMLEYDAAALLPAPSRPACARALILWGDRVVGLLDAEVLWPLLERGIA